jgi:hypothetical protein
MELPFKKGLHSTFILETLNAPTRHLATKFPGKCIATNDLTYLSVHQPTTIRSRRAVFSAFRSNKSITSTLLLLLNLEGGAVEEWGEAHDTESDGFEVSLSHTLRNKINSQKTRKSKS